MGVAWNENEKETFRGFVFVIDDLPLEYRKPARWREYLFSHTVPGEIIEDVLLKRQVETGAAGVISRAWLAEIGQLRLLEGLCVVGPHGAYSFNPDDHPGAHNCVTWATEVVNKALGEVLPRVRQGRIKLMSQVLEEQQNESKLV